MHGTEVSTAVAQGIPVTWVILNDGQLSASIASIRGRMDPSSVVSIGATDLAAMACAHGAEGDRGRQALRPPRRPGKGVGRSRTLRAGYRYRSRKQQTRNRIRTMKREPVILDTTIRDGSYAVNFQYTADDLRTIIGISTRRASPTSKSGMASPSAPRRRRAGRLRRTRNISAPAAPWSGSETRRRDRPGPGADRDGGLGRGLSGLSPHVCDRHRTREFRAFRRARAVKGSRGFDSTGQVPSFRAGCAGPCCRAGPIWGSGSSMWWIPRGPSCQRT